MNVTVRRAFFLEIFSSFLQNKTTPKQSYNLDLYPNNIISHLEQPAKQVIIYQSSTKYVQNLCHSVAQPINLQTCLSPSLH